jgi:hypothetical protein
MTRWLMLAIFAFSASACSSSLSAAAKKDIESQMALAHAPITACYESELKSNPDLQGKMLVKFKIAETSKAFTFVEVASDGIQSPELEKCVIAKTQELRLAAAPGVPVSVSYPLAFSPKK